MEFDRVLWKNMLGDTMPPIVVAHSRMRDEGFHAHDHNFHEIVVVIDGRGRHRCVYGEQIVARGDVLILQPGIWHEYYDCQRMDYYDCYFQPDLLRRELLWTRENPVLSHLFWGASSLEQPGFAALHLDDASVEKCRAQLDALQTAKKKDSIQRRTEQLGHFLLLLDELVAHISLKHTAPPRALHPSVLCAIELLQANTARQWNLKGLAREVHITPEYLARLFTRTTGLPPLAYLARCRGERAAALLLTTDLPIGEVAARVGWSDPNHFARRFKTHFSMSPTAYRQKLAALSR